MGNYFAGSLDLIIDHKKISCVDMVNIARKYNNENLYYQFGYLLNEDHFNKHGLSNLDYLIVDVRDNWEDDSPVTKKFMEFLTFLKFPMDLLKYDCYINYKDYMEDSKYDKYLSDQIAEAIDNIRDKNDVFKVWYINVSCNTKHYKETDCESSILGLIEALKEYKLTAADNDIGYIKDEDFTYNRNFFWSDKEAEDEYERRKYLCDGCDSDRGKYNLCGKFKYCERAYNIGKGE